MGTKKIFEALLDNNAKNFTLTTCSRHSRDYNNLQEVRYKNSIWESSECSSRLSQQVASVTRDYAKTFPKIGLTYQEEKQLLRDLKNRR